MAAAVVGCGGGSDSVAEASASFLNPKTKSKIPKFGEEAVTAEREAASEVLERNLEARETGDWETQCATLTVGAVKKVEEEFSFFASKSDCVRSLTAASTPLSSSEAARANTMTGPIDALRTKGDRAFALYHGTQGKDYAMPMEMEDGEWKVDDVVTEELK
jgi:hypothetical protein